MMTVKGTEGVSGDQDSTRGRVSDDACYSAASVLADSLGAVEVATVELDQVISTATGNATDFEVYWFRLTKEPSDDEIDDCLTRIQRDFRGK